jgi:asparagine synthase (glutamine-hydrolysing)
MSGIAGIRPAAGSPDSHGLVAAMAKALYHRGPASEMGFDVGAGERLAVRYRAGEEPCARSGDLVIAFDGELYGVEALRAELAAANHPVSSAATDAALALAAYQCFGVGGFGRLDGSWALALHDGRDGHTHLAVDPSGAGALYRSLTVNGSELYASEPAALLAAGIPAAANDEVVRRFLLTGAAGSGEETFFAGVSRVPAGHVVTLSGHGARVTSYPVPDPTTPAPAEALADSLGARSTRGRIGVHLSHGLAGALLVDSVSIVDGADVLAATFPPLPNPSDGLAAALGVAPRVVAVDIAEAVPEFVRAIGEPVGDLGLITMFAVATRSADRLDVLLDAAGADAVLPPVPPKAKRVVDPSSLVITDDAVAGGDPRSLRTARVQEALRLADRVGARSGVRVRLPYAESATSRALGEASATRPGGARAVASAVIGSELGVEVVGASGGVQAGAPVRDVLLRMKNRVYGEFLSESFVNRPWFRQPAVLVAFEDFIKGRNADAPLFWRLLAVELWAREFLDPAPVELAPAVVKGPLEPNAGKQLAIDLDGERWLRFPLRTELFAKDDPLDSLVAGYVESFFDEVRADGAHLPAFERPWYVLVSEKIVAISQGRSYFIWDIEPSWAARTLSRFVVRTPYGIGLGSPWTMQLAIDEAGLPRILAASALGAAGKVVGRRGLFYRVAGHSVRAIDGPTEYSAYPSNVSAKLAPARPDEVSASLLAELTRRLEAAGHTVPARTLRGVVVIDANDIGRNVLGQAADRPASFFEALFADNPLGQGSELTPIAVAVSGG